MEGEVKVHRDGQVDQKQMMMDTNTYQSPQPVEPEANIYDRLKKCQD